MRLVARPDPSPRIRVFSLGGDLEDRCKWLEEKFKAMENTDYLCRVDAKDLSLVSDIVLPAKFKTPESEKYNGAS
ncbi:WAT1-related protein [Gossypium australe]|uniref:WAT1-related protein n=1 Tax=Gossypium australe TaxID=47621 RepID=A0A5B6UY76_9ROSI|nr:WAT1-related protein [Gossypium australe]